jgi:chromosome partitioning protein
MAMALHRLGRTLGVDADPVTRSLRAWHEAAEHGAFPFAVTGADSPQLLRGLADQAADYEHVVIDGPPGDLGILAAAARQATLVLVPVSPTGLDLNRLRPTFEKLAELEDVHPVDVGVLLTKVRTRTRSARDAREALAELGYPVLDTEIPLAEAYAGAFGSAPADLGKYEDLLMELKS